MEPVSIDTSARDRARRIASFHPGKRLRGVLAAALVVVGASALAKEASPEAADPALEARMVRVTSELRCLVCPNQTIADSNASLAVDLRREARALLKQGKTDAEVVDY